MRRMLLLLLLYVAFSLKISAQGDSDINTFSLTEGDTLDAAKREYYCFFPYTTGFQWALFSNNVDGSISAHVFILVDGTCTFIDITRCQTMKMLERKFWERYKQSTKCAEQEFKSRISVSVSLESGATISGELVMVRESSIVLATQRKRHVVGTHSIRSLDIEQGSNSRGSRFAGAARGFAIGALAGSVVGFASGDDKGGIINFSGGEKALVLGVAFGAVGFVVGAMNSGEPSGETGEQISPVTAANLQRLKPLAQLTTTQPWKEQLTR
jgi:hypothetical protein